MHRIGYLDAMLQAARISRASRNARLRMFRMHRRSLTHLNALDADTLIDDSGIYFL